MRFRGKSQGGVIVLEPGVSIPDGTEVDVTPRASSEGESTLSRRPAIWDQLLELAREAEAGPSDLPPDLAENHDHYIHGTPKRS